MKIIYEYKDMYNGEIKNKNFSSFYELGKWIADNAVKVINIDCVIKEN